MLRIIIFLVADRGVEACQFLTIVVSALKK